MENLSGSGSRVGRSRIQEHDWKLKFEQDPDMDMDMEIELTRHGM